MEKLGRGDHRKADGFDLAFVIAKEFKRYIGTPRPATGPLTGICEYCFEILEIKGGKKGDRTRAIRQALKKLCSSDLTERKYFKRIPIYLTRSEKIFFRSLGLKVMLPEQSGES
jgi:hypothetical protein